MRFSLTTVASAAALSFASLLLAPLARAEDCPEGDWFCEPTPQAQPEPPLADEVPPNAVQAEPRNRRRFHGHGSHYRDPGRHRVRLRTPPVPEPSDQRRKLEWGFGPHVFGALLGGDDEMASNAGMGGLGFTLRLRPLPELAIDGNIELAFGTDYNGYDRQEAAALFHAVGFLNPSSRLQAYVMGGFGLSAARVSVVDELTPPLYLSYEEDYSYFGVNLGVGAEFRVTRRTALHADVIGFVRDRTGSRRNSRPEFVNPRTHLATDTSGGGLIRIGALFYW